MYVHLYEKLQKVDTKVYMYIGVFIKWECEPFSVLLEYLCVVWGKLFMCACVCVLYV